MVGEIGHRLDTNCRWQQYKYTVCVQGAVGERTWSSGRWRCAKCRGVLCTGFTSRAPGIAVAFRSIVPKIPDELEGRPGVPWGPTGEATLAAGPPLRPPLGETSEAGLCFLGPLFPLMLCGKGMGLLKYWIFQTFQSMSCFRKMCWVLLFCIFQFEERVVK